MTGLGERLRQARLSKGLSLEDVEQATKIRRIYLDALEAEEFQLLPHPHGRGFAMAYARYLRLDEVEVTNLLPQDGVMPRLEPLPQLPHPPLSVGTWLSMVLVVAIVAFLGFYLYQQGRTSATTPARVSVPLPTATTTTVPTQTPVSSGVAATATSVSGRVAATPTPVPLSPTPTPTAKPEPPPQLVSMPSVVGLDYTQAEDALRRIGLQVAREEEEGGQVVGQVVRQSPAPNQPLASGALVRLWVSKGPTRAVVPRVKGLTEAAAREAIKKAGLVLSPWINYQGHDGTLPPSVLEWACVGCVLSITPDEGTQVDFGTTVNIAVRKD
ncbi:MAG: helix-turn-helix domain-containing protein [Chloroflexi bacterium]|nr:helix-turn-helix domain-containing protein [Chloroflexota bacterium]